MQKVVRSVSLAACAVAALAACEDTVVARGYQIDERRVAQIAPGTTTKRDVVRIMGTPSTVATFDDQSWYYVAQRYRQMNFFVDDLTSQDVVTVRFDDKGIVTAVDQVDIQSAQEVVPDPASTRTMGNELSLAEEFIGNIGRFNTDAGSAASAFRNRRPGGI